MMRFLAGATMLTLLACTATHKEQQTEDWSRFVSPYIGTGSHGHVFLGASVPFGAVQLGPVNMTEGWDWCSGYNYADSTIIGFSHTRLSGTGIGDLGDILFMPVTGDVKPVKGVLNDYNSGYYSLFTHDSETVSPGYYAVFLPRYQVKAELTATTRTGFHQYHFPKAADAGIVIDLKEGVGWDRVTATSLRKVNDTTIEGSRLSTGWAKAQQIYFHAVFSKPIADIRFYEDTVLQAGTAQEGIKLKAHLRFAGAGTVQVKVGISPVSSSHAADNIKAELPGWDFAAVAQAARTAWNKEFNKIRIETVDTARLRTFYTAMYHTMMAPAVFNDANGAYRGADGKVYDD
ncbi:MAG: glycoside hydrolase family 92 protein, partial [Chitinophagaceae bacterium]|nr:glycoside hydrolase family 92 protein [Chitinophagaceae bacterium]